MANLRSSGAKWGMVPDMVKGIWSLALPSSMLKRLSTSLGATRRPGSLRRCESR